MDVMEMRRRIIEAMASGGAEVIKGAITIGSDWYDYTFQFGKSFSKYFYYFEMTDESKTALVNSGSTVADNVYAIYGVYAPLDINNVQPSAYSLKQSFSVPNSNIIPSMTPDVIKQNNSSSFTMQCRGLGTRNAFYKGYTYNYYIIEIK